MGDTNVRGYNTRRKKAWVVASIFAVAKFFNPMVHTPLVAERIHKRLSRRAGLIPQEEASSGEGFLVLRKQASQYFSRLLVEVQRDLKNIRAIAELLGALSLIQIGIGYDRGEFFLYAIAKSILAFVRNIFMWSGFYLDPGQVIIFSAHLLLVILHILASRSRSELGRDLTYNELVRLSARTWAFLCLVAPVILMGRWVFELWGQAFSPAEGWSLEALFVAVWGTLFVLIATEILHVFALLVFLAFEGIYRKLRFSNFFKFYWPDSQLARFLAHAAVPLLALSLMYSSFLALNNRVVDSNILPLLVIWVAVLSALLIYWTAIISSIINSPTVVSRIFIGVYATILIDLIVANWEPLPDDFFIIP